MAEDAADSGNPNGFPFNIYGAISLSRSRLRRLDHPLKNPRGEVGSLHDERRGLPEERQIEELEPGLRVNERVEAKAARDGLSTLEGDHLEVLPRERPHPQLEERCG